MHENFKLRCNLCQFTTSRQGNLNVHKKVVHSDNKNKVFCNKCCYSSNYVSALKRHNKVQHGGMTSDCEEYKYIQKDNTQNVVAADSDYCYIDSNVLKHTTKVEDINSQQSSNTGVLNSKSGVIMISPQLSGLHGSQCSIFVTPEPEVCKPCGYTLEPDETLDEHIVSVHLSADGSCGICGENSEDFIEHFQSHVEKIEDRWEDDPIAWNTDC